MLFVLKFIAGQRKTKKSLNPLKIKDSTDSRVLFLRSVEGKIGLGRAEKTASRGARFSSRAKIRIGRLLFGKNCYRISL